MTFLITVAILHLIPLNILVSYRCLREPLFDGSQKAVYLTLIWLVPFLGALAVWYLRRARNLPDTPEE
jgi:hypothetical protein